MQSYLFYAKLHLSYANAPARSIPVQVLRAPGPEPIFLAIIDYIIIFYKIDLFNYGIGTQTFSPLYHFTDKARLVETAEAIQGMGSTTI